MKCDTGKKFLSVQGQWNSIDHGWRRNKWRNRPLNQTIGRLSQCSALDEPSPRVSSLTMASKWAKTGKTVEISDILFWW